MDLLQLAPDLEVSHIGPPLEEGRLPSVFYFALSARESLELDPYNQPAVFLAEKGIRVFSLNLPAHGPNLNAIDAIGVWAEEYAHGRDPLTPFLQQFERSFAKLFEKRLLFKEKVGLMGLSRGGFLALHAAAKMPDIRTACCFAPLTSLSYAKEFEALSSDPKVGAMDAHLLAPLLYDKPIRIYIGNRDVRVSTTLSYKLVETFANTAFEKGVRSPPIELILSPSIGHKGHGTSKEVFEAGAKFVGKQLGAIR